MTQEQAIERAVESMRDRENAHAIADASELIHPAKRSPEGAEIGARMAVLAEHGSKIAETAFPGHAQPCHDCAFRRGTLPNEDALTQLDVMTCVASGTPFYCHVKGEDAANDPKQLCAGWALASLDDIGVAQLRIIIHAAEEMNP